MSNDCLDTREGPLGITEEENYGGHSKADLRHNMRYCIMLDAIWSTGWADFQLALQPLLVYLGASNTVIGLITGATIAGLIGLFISPWITRRYPIKKWYLFAVNIPYLAPLGISGAAIVASRHLGLSNDWLVMFILVMMLAHQFFAGFVALPHQEYIAACIPMSHRGRFSGISASAGSLAAIGSAAIGGWILTHYARPMSFGYLFLMTWVICQGGYVFALMAREKPTPVEKSPRPWSKVMLKAAWDDKPYLRVLVVYFLYLLVLMNIFGFVNVYGFRELRMAANTAAVIAIIGNVVRVCLSGYVGVLTDRFSPKRVVPYLAVLSCVALLPVIFIRNVYGVYISAGISSMFVIAFFASMNALLYGLPKPENRPGHYTIQIIIGYIAGFIGPFALGRLCDVLPYRSVFVIVAVFSVFLFVVGKQLLSTLSDDASAYS